MKQLLVSFSVQTEVCIVKEKQFNMLYSPCTKRVDLLPAYLHLLLHIIETLLKMTNLSAAHENFYDDHYSHSSQI